MFLLPCFPDSPTPRFSDSFSESPRLAASFPLLAMTFFATKLMGAFLLPPLNLLVLSGVGIALLKSRPRLGRSLVVISWLLLYALSTPVIGGALLRSLEHTPPLRPGEALPEGDAIVVLGGGIYYNAPEYGGDSTKGYVLERLRYAARLHRLTGKPILVTGGVPSEATVAEAMTMKEALVNDFQVPVRWVEDQSRTTLENARFSVPILREQGVRQIYLVTHAAHMPRAQAVFEQQGFQVVPAPTMFTTKGNKLSPFAFLPNPSTLMMSYDAMHEWIGRLWYWFRTGLT